MMMSRIPNNAVGAYATRIMELIDEDIHGLAAEGDLARANGLRAARSFTDLHDFVDANEYMIAAEVPFDPSDKTVMDFYVDVQDEVTRRLSVCDVCGLDPEEADWAVIWKAPNSLTESAFVCGDACTSVVEAFRDPATRTLPDDVRAKVTRRPGGQQ